MNESKKEIKMKGRKKEKMTERSSTKNIKRMKERFLFHLTVTIREFFSFYMKFSLLFPFESKKSANFSHLHIKDDYGLPPFIFPRISFPFMILFLFFAPPRSSIFFMISWHQTPNLFL